MILLKSNIELKHTFERLIKTMGVPVEWTGLFAVIGDYLILQGKVRSLFFNFENKKVMTNMVEVPVKEDEIIEITEATKVQNVINIVLYAFGKWGTIGGLKVEKNYAQINELFSGVLKEFYINPEYTSENFRFYKESIRLAYEDVVQLVIEAQEKLPEEPEEEKESRQGLWHKLVWKKKQAVFERVETTFAERQKERMGNNFYMVGYLCPECGEKLHMVVFPVDREFRIETPEGAVLLARAYTCSGCSFFYTPRPKKLISEGDVYQMPFVDDRKAYEDYIELLGAAGSRTSNYKFNEFESEKGRQEDDEAERESSLDEIFCSVDSMPEREFQRLQAKIEEGFYPLESVHKYEKPFKSQEKKRRIRKEQEQTETDSNKETVLYGQNAAKKAAVEVNGKDEIHRKDKAIPPEEEQKAKERYEAKLGLLERLSEGQRRELKSKLHQEKYLREEDKQAYFARIDDAEHQKKLLVLEKKAEGCQGKNYAQIKKCMEDIEKEEIKGEMKAPLLEKLGRLKKKQGKQEAEHLIIHMPKHMNLTRFLEFEQQLKAYEGVNLAPYETKINESRKYAEQQEITNLVKRARKNNREDFAELQKKLITGGFSMEYAAPYIDKVKDKVRQMDESAIAEICQDCGQMGFAEGMEAYQKIEKGLFLPELKTNALELLSKRLSMIKTDECELLIKKLKNDLSGKIKENLRHHFYPAGKILSGEASREEMAVIDAALSSYGSNRERFEYPILVVDTSRNVSGREGMILTPDKLLYSTFLNAYDIPVTAIAKFKASTGLINRGLTVELKNGTKIKLPYAVEHGELLAWALALKNFVAYLQEKPESRNVTYLAKEKHENICCFRCGDVYKGGEVCPRCGYKNNR